MRLGAGHLIGFYLICAWVGRWANGWVGWMDDLKGGRGGASMSLSVSLSLSLCMTRQKQRQQRRSPTGKQTDLVVDADAVPEALHVDARLRLVDGVQRRVVRPLRARRRHQLRHL